MEAVDTLPASPNQKVIHQIVDYSAKRIIDFADYDRMKSREHLGSLDGHLRKFIESFTGSSNVGDDLLSIMYFASGSAESLEILRNRIAVLLLEGLNSKFDDLNEEDKFKIAPWLGVFRRIQDENVEL